MYEFLKYLLATMTFVLQIWMISLNTVECFSLHRMRLRKNFHSSSIVPDLIDNVPQYLLRIKYSSSVEVKLGNELDQSTIRDAPKTVEWRTKSSIFNTLLMVDMDGSIDEQSNVGEMLHWLIINIPSNQIQHGETYSQYLRPTSNGTDLHRIVFLVYRQPIGPIVIDDQYRIDEQTLNGRSMFNTRQFVQRYNLTGPIAGNFFCIN